MSTQKLHSSWDTQLAWVALGYRVTPQSSTRFAPYQMLYATLPTVPAAAKERLSEPIDFDNVEVAANSLWERSKVLTRLCVNAGQNLRIAQHQDSLRYAVLRSGSYLPKVKRFETGDFVYVRHNTSDGKPPNNLTSLARPEVLRVLDVRGSGVLILQGKDGTTVSEHMTNCTPCHLPILDASLDLGEYRPPIDFPCQVCNLPDRANIMVLCDTCGTGWHTTCLNPPLDKVPFRYRWDCPRCLGHYPPFATWRTGTKSSPTCLPTTEACCR